MIIFALKQVWIQCVWLFVVNLILIVCKLWCLPLHFCLCPYFACSVFLCSCASSLVLNTCVCLGTKLRVTYFPTHLKLTPFTPAWQRTPVHMVVNNSHWPSAPLTFTCCKLIMTSSVVHLINLCETQNLKDYYDDFCLCFYIVLLFISVLWRLTWPSLLLCIVKRNLHLGNDQGRFDGKDVKAIVELFWENS